jgi:hypothetical protein
MAIPNPNQITSVLRMMPDQQLQQYAAMHKDDPYIFPMAFAESNARKEARAAQQAMAMGQPQPKVVDQDLMAMASQPPIPPQGGMPQGGPQMAQQQLPEHQGIGALPAQNIQHMADGGIAGYAGGGMDEQLAYNNEPVMRMAGGGAVQHFAEKGAVNPSGFTPEMQQYLLEQAQANNVDPQALMAIVKAESRGKVGAQSDTSTAHGLFQIIDKTFKNAGGDPAKRHDPFENIRVGAKLLGDNAKVLRNQLKRDPSPDELYATHFLGTGTGGKLLQAHPDTPMSSFLYSADKENADKIMSSNKKLLGGKTVGEVRQTLANKLFSAIPMGAANAATVPSGPPTVSPQGTPGDLASQIPGQRAQAPASTAEQENSYFGRLADTLGISPEVQRNINNTLNAAGGYSSPVSTANRMVGVASGALKATPEMIAEAEKARRIANTVRLPAPAKAGLEALDAASQATRDAAVAARQARNLEQDRRAATAAEQSVKAADETANIARKTEEGIAAVPRAQAANTAKAVNAARTLSVNQFGESMFPNKEAAATAGAKESPYDVEDMRKAEPMPTAKEAVDAAKAELPAKERKGMNYDDLLAFGLNLMAGTSPNALTNVGAAGIAALKNKQEREKAEQDLEYKDIMKKYYGSLGKKAESEASYLASGEKGRMADRQKAVAEIQASMDAWAKAKAGMYTPEEEEAQRRKLTQYFFNAYELPIPATMSSTTGGGLPQGVKVTPYG